MQGRIIYKKLLTHFCRFQKGLSAANLPFQLGRNGQLRMGKLLNLTGRTRNKTDNFQYHYYDVQGAQLFQMGVYFDSPRIYQKFLNFLKFMKIGI